MALKSDPSFGGAANDAARQQMSCATDHQLLAQRLVVE
jgi:hypothetical protein